MYEELVELSKKKERSLLIAKIFILLGIFIELFANDYLLIVFMLLIIGFIISIISMRQEKELKEKVNKYVIDNGIYDKEYKKVAWTIFTKTPWSLLKRCNSEANYKVYLKEFYTDLKK